MDEIDEINKILNHDFSENWYSAWPQPSLFPSADLSMQASFFFFTIFFFIIFFIFFFSGSRGFLLALVWLSFSVDCPLPIR